MKFYIYHHCTCVVVGEVVMSLGGDANPGQALPDGTCNRLSVAFIDAKTRADRAPPWLTDAEQCELKRDGVLDVWARPQRYADLLRRHLAAEGKP